MQQLWECRWLRLASRTPGNDVRCAILIAQLLDLVALQVLCHVPAVIGFVLELVESSQPKSSLIDSICIAWIFLKDHHRKLLIFSVSTCWTLCIMICEHVH